MNPRSALSISLLFIAAYFAASLFFPLREIWVYETIFFLTPALLFLKFKPVSLKSFFLIKRSPFKEFLFVGLLTLVISILLDFTLGAWNRLFPLPTSYENFYENILTAPRLRDELHLLFSLGLFPAICEEYFFRGFLQNTLNQRWKKKTAVAVTALLFALCHLNPWYFPFYFLLGLYLGWCQFYRNNILHPILAHAINNIVAIIGFKIL